MQAYPLHPAQRDLYFDQLIHPDSPHYNIGGYLKLCGHLEVEKFKAAARSLPTVFDALRMRFDLDGDTPHIYFDDASQHGELEGIDFNDTGKDAAAIEQWIKDRFNIPFVIKKEQLLFEHCLIKIAAEEHWWYFKFHHLITDGIGVAAVCQQLAKQYNSLLTGNNEPFNFPSYKEEVINASAYYHSDSYAQEGLYWKSRIGERPVNVLKGTSKPDTHQNQGAIYLFDITAEDKALLDDLQAATNASLQQLTIAALMIYCAKTTAHNEFIFGIPLHKRKTKQLRTIAGMFTGILPFKGVYQPGTILLDLLKQIASAQREDYRYQNYLISDLKRDFKLNPIDDNLIEIVVNYALINFDLDFGEAIQSTFINSSSAGLPFPLGIMWKDYGKQQPLQLRIDYQEQYFSADEIPLLVQRLLFILKQFKAQLHGHIDSIDIIPGHELDLLATFNNTSVAYPAGKTLVHLFTEQVYSTPDATAVIFEQQLLTYRELDEQSNQLAHYLQSLGVKEETLVPICIAHSLEMMVGILGILKAGGAYVPIDPQYPAERIKYMLEDTGAAIMLCNSAGKTMLSSIKENAVIIALDDESSSISKYSKAAPPAALTPAHLAYIIYTSGSTGKPKGVMVEHRNLFNYLWFARKRYLSETDSGGGTFAHLPNTFDAAVTSLFVPLIAGKPVTIAANTGAEVFTDPSLQLHAPYDFIKLTPAHTPLLSTFLTGNAGQPVTARLVIGGEALQWSHLQYLLDNKLDVEIINEYGPTEATVGCSTYAFNTAMETVKTGSSILIGKPIDNVQLYMVDERLQSVPIGVLGEICIAGKGVARGYLHQPELTAEKFVANPFCADREGEKMYRTGDFGKWLPDGNIAYAGRRDEQVKVRGYRIELGEIARVLQQCTLVSQAVVIAREDVTGNRQLAGYVVPAGAFDREGILAYLNSQLLGYMVPGLLMELENLPLTANGKVDKKALPDPDTGALSQQAYVAPRNEIEQTLAGIWEALLGIQQVGMYDNFFELGGHSLLAMRLVSGIRQALGIEAPISILFAQPTIAALATHLQSAEQHLPALAVKAGIRPEQIPLSYNQEGLWFIDQFEGSVQYHMAGVLRIKGSLHKAALSGALQGIVNRYEVFRTIITQQNGVAYQQVLDPNQWALTVIEDPVYKYDETRLQSLVQQLAEKPFDLSADHMLRAYLVAMGEEDHALLLVMHHIASDGWSIGIFFRELTELYNSIIAGRSAQLLPLALQYADYAIWQRTYLSEALLIPHLTYWTDKLTGVSTLQLPTDYPRPAVRSTKGAGHSFRLQGELLGALQQLSNRQGTTLFMTLLAALKVLLFRYSGQEDICVGSPIAGRKHQETEDLIGFFVNTLALRSDLGGNPSFAALLAQVKATTLGAFEHQDAPFEKVAAAVVKDRDLSRSPLFQVMFVLLQHAAEAAVVPQLDGLELSFQQIEQTGSKFDLIFSMQQSGDELSVNIAYCSDLYDAATIHRMFGHYEQLLNAIVSNPSRQIAQLELLSHAEREQLLLTFNDTSAAYPADKTVADLFTAQAYRAPDAIAVIFEQQSLSYRELDEQSNQLAHYLQSLGVKAETLVPICIDRSLEMIIGILGILKAGGAYVPVDPQYPAERIKYMLEDTAATMMVSNNNCLPGLPVMEQVLIINMDGDRDHIRAHKLTAPALLPVSSQLAYVIYTSGSTGQPKGVMVTHKNVTSLVTGTNYITLTAEDVILSAGSFSFDATTFEYWGALLNGGRLILSAKKSLLDVSLLKQELHSRGVTKMFFTTGWFNQLVDTDITVFEKLSALLTGGEKLSEQHVAIFRNTYPHIDIRNIYGPTENTTFSLSYPVTSKGLTGNTPIGSPLNNRSAYVLDKEQRLVPVGVPGEIYLGGAGVARGYLNRPGLTAEKFVVNPFSDKAGSRLYKTGDIGCWQADGTILYLGRIDDQVKIRGYRIEPGEIESVLQECTLVSQAVVIAREDATGNKRLVGYIVPTGAFDQEGILAYLNRQLPGYMVPALLMEQENLPLTPNGKVDKKALPDPDAGALSQQAYVAPRNEWEQTLAGIWQELLGVQQVGIYDNFFALGGHSLLVISAVSKINRSFNTRLSPLDLFKHPVLIVLADRLRELKLKGDYLTDNHFVLLNEKKDKNIMMFPPGMAQGLAYISVSKLITSHACYSFNYIHDERRIDLYVEQIEKIQDGGPYILFGWSAGGPLAFEVAKALIKKGHQVSDIIMVDAGRRTHETIKEETDKDKLETDIKVLLEQYKPFETDEDIIEKLTNDTYNYWEYLSGMINKGVVPANIHLLTNESAKKGLWTYNWERSTSGHYKIYPGKGAHIDMLMLPEHLVHNAALINKILADICERTPLNGLLTYPLHPAQRDVYFDQLIHPDSPHYNTGGYFKLSGCLDKEKLKAAASSLPAVFDAFRMSFDPDTPHIYFDDAFLCAELEEMDCTGNSNPEVEQWIRDQLDIPFTIKRGQILFEHYLLKLKEEEHWYYYKVHHLISDGFGIAAAVQYLAKKYNSLLQADGAVFSYPSYKEAAINAAAGYYADDYLKEGLYWKNRIGEKPVNVLRKRYQQETYTREGATWLLDITADDRALLDDLQLVAKVGLQQLTIAALMIYFAKTTAHTEFIFGIPLHKRSTKQLRTIAGMFTGVIPFKGVYGPGTILLDLLKQITATQREDYRYQHYLVSDLRKDFKIHSIDDSLIEVVVNHALLNFDLEFQGGLAATAFNLSNADLSFPLEIMWKDYGKQQPLQLRIDYQDRFFSAAEIPLLVQRLLFILKQFKERLYENIDKIDIIPVQERDLLATFSNTAIVYPAHKTVIDLFTSQVLRTPDAIAVIFEEQSLSYRELHERSNQLAHYLQSLGVKEETLVPICIARSLEMIIGILGILKAGGAYVPIDPDYPADRIHYMLEDTGATIILSSSACMPGLAPTADRYVIALDDDESDISKYPKNAPATALKPTHLAYVIYTSGSTGKPKGVMVEHRAVVNLFKATATFYDFNSKDVWTLFHSFCFDFSVWEMYGALFHGGRLIIVPKHITQHAALFGELVIAQGVTVLNQTPSAFYVLQDHLTVTAPIVPVRYVIFGGEALNPARLQPWMQLYRDCQLINMYGITETTVHTTYLPITWSHLNSGSVIGKTIPSLGIYILDAHQQRAPLGVAGEIYVGGAGLARGYLGLPELTAKRFVANPFSREAGARLYRTGDAGRWLPDGNIEYLGRIDDQVKIRGYRIELGEIESVLQACSLVQQTVVIAKEEATGNKRLLGYIVPQGAFDREGILAYLNSKLPQYMVPALLIALEKLPLTANGKVDKKALPDPVTLAQQAYVAPRNEIEQTLAHIWQELLELEQVGIYDNFFELGGHSLLALSAVSKINRSFNTHLSPLDLFKYPVLATLANFLHEISIKENYLTGNYFALLNEKRERNIILFPPGMGHGLAYISLSKLITSHACYSFNYIHDERRMETYVAQIEKIQDGGPYVLFGWSAGGALAFEVAKALIKKGHQVSDIIMVDSVRRPEIIPIPVIERIDKNIFRKEVAKELDARKLFHADEDLIETITNNAYYYLEYYAGTINEGTIPANIHLIKNGETTDDDILIYDWRNSTTGNYTIYSGKGKHLEMLLSPENIAHNVSIINKILEGINTEVSVNRLKEVHT